MPKTCLARSIKPAQARVIGFVKLFDPFDRFPNRYAARVNLLRLASHTRDCSKAASNPQRARIRERRQLSVEHARVELIRFAVEIKVGARKPCFDQGCAERHGPAKQSIDKSVFRAAQHRLAEPRHVKKTARINIS